VGMESFLSRGIEEVCEIGRSQDILVRLQNERIEISDLEQKEETACSGVLFFFSGFAGRRGGASHLVLGHIEEIDGLAPGSTSRPSLGRVLAGRAHGLRVEGGV